MCTHHAYPLYDHFSSGRQALECHQWPGILNLHKGNCRVWTCKAAHVSICYNMDESPSSRGSDIGMVTPMTQQLSQEPDIWCSPTLDNKWGNGCVLLLCSLNRGCGHWGTASMNGIPVKFQKHEGNTCYSIRKQKKYMASLHLPLLHIEIGKRKEKKFKVDIKKKCSVLFHIVKI